MATPVHQEKRKHQAARNPKIESKDDQPIRENLEKNSVKNLSVKQIKEICDKNLQVRCKNIKQKYLFFLWDHSKKVNNGRYLLRHFPFKELNIVKSLVY